MNISRYAKQSWFMFSIIFTAVLLFIAPASGVPLPEPATMLLLGLGLVGLAGYGRKKFLKK